MTSHRRHLDELLRQPTSRLVELSVEGSLDWADLLWDRSVVVEISGLGSRLADEREGESPNHWRGIAALANWAPTPIVVHNEHFASVESFYHALKYPEGSAERSSVASLSGPEAQQRTRRDRRDWFSYRGLHIGVGSAQHAAIIADAVVAKVAQHPVVADALVSTGRATLSFPESFGGNRTLAQATPLALMIERSRRSDAAYDGSGA